MFSPESAHCFPCVRPQSLLNIIAGVLHLGNAQFGEGEEGETYITTEPQINNLAKVRTVPLVLPDVQICAQSCEEARLRTDVLLFCSCWLLMAVPSGRHSHTRSSLPRGRRWFFLLAHALFKKKKMFPFADCDFSSVLSAITDGECAQFRAGGVIPWHPGQGHVQSDVHVVGGEDQPVPGPQGEASDQMWQKKQKNKTEITRWIWSYSVCLCNAGWTPPQHKELYGYRASWYLWLWSPAAQQVSVTTACRLQGCLVKLTLKSICKGFFYSVMLFFKYIQYDLWLMNFDYKSF